MRRAILSLLHGFVLLFFGAVAVLFFALPQLPIVRLEMVDLLLHRPADSISLGLAFLGATFILFLGFYTIHRSRFLRLKMGAQRVEIDHRLISRSLEECFQAHFKEKLSLVAVSVDSKIDIDVKLAPLDEGQREELFLRVEAALQVLLKERFGYTKPFYLTATL